ncbi:hypothetical protein CesoFtcFv8_022786 [Champsocephalus esox]|uniref:Uncharacterized protein n=1 Tax=Champsocephalus esox TaxID=159716 RepID=A0AAN8B7G6_9TELE|nr:hypothetical protein CesoFtcFv8_022786 [Champsocephalus esox]
MTILHHGRQELVGGEFESQLLKCNVTDTKTGATLLCGAGRQSSCQKTGGTSRGINIPHPEKKGAPKGPVEWWWYIVAAVGLAALLIVIAAVIRWKKTKGDRPRTDDRIEQGLNPAGPENTADREEDVSYASVSYRKNSGGSSRAQGQSKEEDDLVTYSTVKAPSSSSAGVSTDPSSLYATVNKPAK